MKTCFIKVPAHCTKISHGKVGQGDPYKLKYCHVTIIASSHTRMSPSFPESILSHWACDHNVRKFSDYIYTKWRGARVVTSIINNTVPNKNLANALAKNSSGLERQTKNLQDNKMNLMIMT